MTSAAIARFGRPASSLVERNPECVASWPDCYEGGYDPRCCRFPKSCSCEVRQEVPEPATTPPPAGRLVERVQRAIGHSYPDDARAAIREVAAWLREGGDFDAFLVIAAELAGTPTTPDES